jgi:hypothetical protein
MITLRQLASAAEIHLEQTGDDSKIPFSQLVFYANLLVNKYLSVKTTTYAESGGTGSNYSIYPDVPVVTPTSNITPDIVTGRKYFEIPVAILDLDGDNGIDYVTYHHSIDSSRPVFTSIQFFRTTPTKALRISQSTYEKPSSDNAYWYRVGSRVFLLGVEEIYINKVEVGLKTSFNVFSGVNGGNSSSIDYCTSEQTLDTPIDIDEYGDVIIKELVSLGRFGLLIPEERVNDGSGQMQGEVPTQKIVSVNPDS